MGEEGRGERRVTVQLINPPFSVHVRKLNGGWISVAGFRQLVRNSAYPNCSRLGPLGLTDLETLDIVCDDLVVLVTSCQPKSGSSGSRRKVVLRTCLISLSCRSVLFAQMRSSAGALGSSAPHLPSCLSIGDDRLRLGRAHSTANDLGLLLRCCNRSWEFLLCVVAR